MIEEDLTVNLELDASRTGMMQTDVDRGSEASFSALPLR